MSNKIKGAVLMIISSVAFAMMQIFIAMTSQSIPVFEQMIFRNVVTAVISYVALKRKKAISIWGARGNRGLLLARSVFGFGGMFCLFYATSMGNQGEVAILSKLSPFVVILLAMLFLGEKVKQYQKIALLLAVTGAFITANPSFEGLSVPVLAAALSSVFSGIAYFCVGSLRGKEHPEVIVFVFSTFTTAICVGITIFWFEAPSPHDFLMLVAVGVFAAIGQLTLTYSYTVASASEVSVFNYSGIPAAMILGYLILGQPVKTTTWVGSLLVVVAGVLSFLCERRTKV